VETKPQTKHPSDIFADQYVKSLADSGWQIHRAYTQGFNTGSVNVVVVQAQQLLKLSQSEETPTEFRPGLYEAARYLAAVAKGETYAIEKRDVQKDDIEKHQGGTQGRETAKTSGRHRHGKSRQIEAQA